MTVAAAFLLMATAAPEPPALAQPLLQPWAGLVGHCWSGDAPGKSGVDTHCFESVYGGQHIRDRHVVTRNGKSVYAGETLYSVEGDRVSLTYWNSLGGLGRGTAVSVGDELRSTGTIHATATGKEQPMTALWTLREGGYEVRTRAGDAPLVFRRAD